ncbi:acyltransferase [Candidatus Parcubacteria bacterium]|nr:acyltransferase [Patescibacteria group bacterium]MBU4477221.1 acyltransferase [Patescibacteria group bacterium]MCG2699176.1 acyltransferase [Candidatus Parcubacteria bacterium]
MKSEKNNSPKYDASLLKSVGDDVFISANVEIRRPHLVSAGNHIAIDSGFYLTTEASIGDYIHIGPYVAIIGGARSSIKIGNFINLTLGSKFICGSDSFSGNGLVTAPGIPEELLNERNFGAITIKDFGVVCAGAIIMPGVTIAEGSVIGANSLVTKSTEPWTIYFGNPARPIKIRPKNKMIEYAKKLGY